MLTIVQLHNRVIHTGHRDVLVVQIYNLKRGNKMSLEYQNMLKLSVYDHCKA